MRKKLKLISKQQLKRNYLTAVLVCVIFVILAGGAINYTKNTKYNLVSNKINIKFDRNQLVNFKALNNSEMVIEFLQDWNNNNSEEKEMKGTEGFLGQIIYNINKTGSISFGLLNAANQFLFQDRVIAGFIILLGVLLSLLYWIFISKTLLIGKKRYFLESRIYKKTKLKRLFFCFKIRMNYQLAKKMLYISFKYYLNCLTIVGIFTKYYAYILVPYILAENPNISAKEALNLSENLMQNHKWKLFVIDLSLIFHYFLGMCTLNLYNILFTTPYHEYIRANYYIERKASGQKNKLSNIELLADKNLEGDELKLSYPKNSYIQEYSFKKWLTIDYKKDYSLITLILFFFLFSFCGWMWEVILELFNSGFFVNRGAFHGPWLPIYGSGGVLIIVLLKKVRDNIPITFLLALIICGIIEYLTSWYLELTKNIMYWNYFDYFLNINGRICLEGLLFFGVGGCLFVYVFAPIIDNLLKKISEKAKMIIAIILLFFFAIDIIYSNKNPNIGEGITNDILQTEK